MLKGDMEVKKTGKNSGFIFVDSMLAVVVVAVAITALLGALTMSLRVEREKDKLKMAAILAENQLTWFKQYDGKGVDRLSPKWNTEKTQDGFNVSSSVLSEAEIPADIKDNQNIVPVRVVVEWQEKGELRRYENATYYLAAPGY